MKRILATAKFIDLPKDLTKDLLFLTPNAAAAARLDVPHGSLRRIAEDILNREGIGVASPLRSLHALKSVIGKMPSVNDVQTEAARLRPILSTVLRDGIDIAAMEKSGLQSAKKLAYIANAHADELWKENLIDADSVLWKAGEIITERRKILVYGYFRARWNDIRFIDKLAGDGSIYVVPSGTESIFASVNRSIEWLVERGWEKSDRGSSFESKTIEIAARFADGKAESVDPDQGSCKAFAYPNLDVEVRATLGAVKQMIVEGIVPSRIAVVCRKAADYEQTISAVAEEYGVPVCSQSKAALAETKLGHYIALILETIETDFEFRVTARLLNHAYGPGLNDAGWLAARKQRARGIAGWHGAGVDITAFAAAQDQTLEKWLGWLLKIIPLAVVRDRSKANAAELIAYQRFCDAAEEFKALDDGQEIAFVAFSAIVKELLSNIDTRIDPGRGGVPLHQPDTVIGGEFDHVFVMGMAEGMLPAATNEDAVIDFYDQRRLEERGAKFDRPVEFPRWEALSFYYVLLAAKNGVTLSYPKSIETDEKIASPFFERLAIAPVEAKLNSVASPQEELKIFLRADEAPFKDGILSAARHQYDVERRRESPEPYDEYDGVIGVSVNPEGRRWSVSQLTSIGQCPFKWFARTLLSLAAVDEADTDLREDVKGRLYHKTLQIAVERTMSAHNFPQAVLDELENAFREAEEDEEIAVRELPNWEHRRAEHLEILRKAVASPDFIAKGSRVIATEKEYKAKWNGLSLTGRIDRIDETQDGLVAVDYKTGSYIGKVKDASGELKTDIQLPIYTRVALESLFPGKATTSGHYFSIKQRKVTKETDVPLDAFAGQVRGLLETGNFAVDPDGKRDSCKYCEYDSVCRQGQRNSRKQT